MVLGPLTIKFRTMWKWLLLFTVVNIATGYFGFISQNEMVIWLYGDASNALFLILMWIVVRGRMKYHTWKYS
jgi:hypothetical protein